MVRACRTCLIVVQNESSLYHEFQSSSGGVSLKDKLGECIPDLFLESVEKDIMCSTCFKKLESFYAFKQKCIDSQYKIYDYMQLFTAVGTEWNLSEISMYYNRENNSPGNHVVSDCDKVDVGTTTDDLYNKEAFEDSLSLEEGEEPDSDEMQIDKDKKSEVRIRSVSSLNSLDESGVGNRTVVTPYECTLCEFSCLSLGDYRVHVILHKGEIPPFKCDECTAFLPGKKELLEHVAEHTKEKTYICRHCDYATPSKTNYAKHRDGHHKSRGHSHRCKECATKFKSSEKLKLHHLQVHTKKKGIFHCHLCKYVCTSNIKLQFHLENTSNHGTDYANGITEPKQYKCKLCKLTLNDSRQFNFHMKWHRTNRYEQTTCTICWWRSETHNDLKLHIKLMHKTCRICFSTFASYILLKQHLRDTNYHKIDQAHL